MRLPSTLCLILACSACGANTPAADSGANPDSGEAPDAEVDAAAPPDVGTPADSSAGSDASTPDCVADNSAAAVARRFGFLEVCADRAAHPNAVCGDGSTFKFSYRPASGTSAGLLIYFRGGGACTDYVSCWGQDGMGGTGRRVATMENEVASPIGVAGYGTFGYFDARDTANPFRDLDVVFGAYCTGDAGQGMTERVLVAPPGADPGAPAMITTYFHGKYNLDTVVAFARSVFPAPARLVVAGSSAGSYISMSALPGVVDAYPSVTRIGYVSDGGIGAGSPNVNQIALDTITRYDGQAGRRLVRFGQFTFQSDGTQLSFAQPPYNTEPEFRGELRRLLELRQTTSPGNYRYFAAPGSCHTIGQTPGLYRQFAPMGGRLMVVNPPVTPNPDLTVAGTNVVDWIRTITLGDGPIDAAVPSPAGDWATASTVCNLPGT